MQISAVDAHIHCWNPTRNRYTWLDNVPALNHSILLEELEQERLSNGVSAGVLVQAANTFEDTEWMLESAAAHPWIRGIVAWLPLTDPPATNDLLENKYSREPLIRGIRHLIHDEADPRWLLQAPVLESLRLVAAKNLSYDFVGTTREHLQTALELSAKVPDLHLVFDHLNQPPAFPSEKYEDWKTLLSELSANKNYMVKISGLGTAVGRGEDWEVDDIRKSVDFVLRQFGHDRCFCGGDWPVSLLAGSYTKSWTIYRSLLSELLDHEAQEKVLAANAARFYRF